MPLGKVYAFIGNDFTAIFEVIPHKFKICFRTYRPKVQK